MIISPVRRTIAVLIGAVALAAQGVIAGSRLSWADRAVLAALARLLPGGQLRLIISPRTRLRPHAHLVRQRWTYPRQAPERPRTAQVIPARVLEMARG
jgi:putative transposase